MSSRKRIREEHLKEEGTQCFTLLDSNIWAQILHFCDMSDLFSMRQVCMKSQVEAHKTLLKEAIAIRLETSTSLEFSFLLKTFPNGVNKTRDSENRSTQNVGVWSMTSYFKWTPDAEAIFHKNRIQRFQLSGLHHVTSFHSSSQWQRNYGFLRNIQTLDLAGCGCFDGQVLATLLRLCNPETLRHVNIHGCKRATVDVLQVIGQRHQQLVSLDIGGCSQQWNNNELRLLRIHRMKSLEHLTISSYIHWLGNLHDSSAGLADVLPSSLKSLDLSHCRSMMWIMGPRFWEYVRENMRANGDPTANAANPLRSRHCQKLQMLNLDNNGFLRSAPRGGASIVLMHFATGRNLRDVQLAGGESVGDGIRALASSCGHCLTSIQLRASNLGDDGLRAIAQHCQVLAELDISACFQVTNDGLNALCESTTRTNQSLRSFQFANCGQITGRCLLFSGECLPGLLLLNAKDCAQLSTSDVFHAIRNMPNLLEVTVSGTSLSSGRKSLMQLVKSIEHPPWRGLIYVNKQRFQPLPRYPDRCCSARRTVQRVHARMPMQTMMHCHDCDLLPEYSRGMCMTCSAMCHKGHRTFVGSWTRFYCDCPFGIAPQNPCQALFPTTESETAVVEANN